MADPPPAAPSPAPDGPALEAGSKVLVNSNRVGTIAYKGEVHFASGVWYGVQLEKAVGTTDGSYTDTKTGETRRYFTCPPCTGLFVRSSSLQVFTPEAFAAAKIQASARMFAARKTVEDVRNFQVYTAMDADLEKLGLHRESAFVAQADLHQADALTPPSIDSFQDIDVPDTYEGPHFGFPVTLDHVMELYNWFDKRGRLHAKYTLQLLAAYQAVVAAMPTVVECSVESGTTFTIVGDLHGQWADLVTIFSRQGFPSASNRYLFNGDVVDRGACGVEIMLLLVSFQLASPTSVLIQRGNHECWTQNCSNGFMDEVLFKYSATHREKVFWAFQSVFKCLPLCSILSGQVFVTHGGLFGTKGVKIAHLQRIERKRDIPPVGRSADEMEDHMFEALMWSDPGRYDGATANPRGAGVLWGADMTRDFLRTNRLRMVIRSHQPKLRGFEYHHDDRVMTLFSASFYEGLNNQGAYAVFHDDMTFTVNCFEAVSVAGPKLRPSRHQDRVMASKVTRKLVIENVCANKSSLYKAFATVDAKGTGLVSRMQWAFVMQQVTQLDLPWLWLCPRLVKFADKERNYINYLRFLDRFSLAMHAGWTESVLTHVARKLFASFAQADEVFAKLDINKDGKIQYDEFITALSALDLGLSESQIYELSRFVDADRNGYIDMAEFRACFQVRSQHRTRALAAGDVEAQRTLEKIGLLFFESGVPLKDIFEAFDTNSDGTVSYDEFVEGLKVIGADAPDDRLKQLAQYVDVNGTGCIDPVVFFNAFTINIAAPNAARAAAVASAAGDGEAEADGDMDGDGDGVEEGEEDGGEPPKPAGAANGEEAAPNVAEVDSQGLARVLIDRVLVAMYESRMNLKTLFRLFDTDGDGNITPQEFRTGLDMLGLLSSQTVGRLPDEQVNMLIKALDTDADGNISVAEFENAFRVVDHETGEEEHPSGPAAFFL